MSLDPETFKKCINLYIQRYGVQKMGEETAELFWKKLKGIDPDMFVEIWSELVGREGFAFPYGKVIELYRLKTNDDSYKEEREWKKEPQASDSLRSSIVEIPTKMVMIRNGLAKGSIKTADDAKYLFMKWCEKRGLQNMVHMGNQDLIFWVQSLKDIEDKLSRGIKVPEKRNLFAKAL